MVCLRLKSTDQSTLQNVKCKAEGGGKEASQKTIHKKVYYRSREKPVRKSTSHKSSLDKIQLR